MLVTTDDVQLTPVQRPGDEHTGTEGTPEVHVHPVVRDPLLEKPAAISHIAVSWPADIYD